MDSFQDKAKPAKISFNISKKWTTPQQSCEVSKLIFILLTPMQSIEEFFWLNFFKFFLTYLILEDIVDKVNIDKRK